MSGGPILLDRFTALGRELGLTPSQIAALFDTLPRGSQRAAWGDLQAHVGATRGTATC